MDVFQAVKTLRKSRPQLVSSPMEYKYCYDVVLHYVLNYCGEDGAGNQEKEDDEGGVRLKDDDLVAVVGGSYYGAGEEVK